MTAAPDTNARNFLDFSTLDADTLRDILQLGTALKNDARTGSGARPLVGKALAMIFEAPSTRTRVSFEVAMKQLGGDAVVLTPTEMQIGRGETLSDTARVLSRYVDAIMIRTADGDRLAEIADHADVPVINGLTDQFHPCQLMADIMTFEDIRGPIRGRTIAWVGDGNNMASSWMQAAARFEFELRLTTPAELRPDQAVMDWAISEGGKIIYTENPQEGVAGADCVVTDTWLSMGQDGMATRQSLLAPYRVDETLMALAASDAIFMHCLPAHRGDEATAAVLDGPQSVIWDEAENRLHAQKGILAWCME